MDNSDNTYVALNMLNGANYNKFRIIKLDTTSVDVWSVNSVSDGVPKYLLFEDQDPSIIYLYATEPGHAIVAQIKDLSTGPSINWVSKAPHDLHYSGAMA